MDNFNENFSEEIKKVRKATMDENTKIGYLEVINRAK
jgi:hypothetical protein